MFTQLYFKYILGVLWDILDVLGCTLKVSSGVF